jgi:hypothetical protein
VTSLPTWAVWVLAFGSPVLAFVGVVLGQTVTRRGARELEFRSKREEVMRVLRWAAELAVSDDQAHSRLGVAELGALLQSELLDEEEKDFVQAALTAVVRVPVEQIEQIEQLGRDAVVIAESELPTEPMAVVASQVQPEVERGDG